MPLRGRGPTQVPCGEMNYSMAVSNQKEYGSNRAVEKILKTKGECELFRSDPGIEKFRNPGNKL